ncbi:MAG: hypothetical protein SGI86_04620 [Deltaproteobacteria bacterium]|nr:hypothetical protein [Deltaproteobacteria bacterium]
MSATRAARADQPTDPTAVPAPPPGQPGASPSPDPQQQYPQQQYPQQQYPQQQYPQQQYPQQQYPQQQYQQPYPQQYVPPPPPSGPKESGLEGALFIGAVFPDEDYVGNVDTGVRFGGLLGGRLSSVFSLAAGLDIDVHSPRGGNLEEVSVIGVGLSIVPSLHLPFANGEFVVSGKLGVSGIVVTYDVDGSTETLSGTLAGLALTAAFNVNQMRMGPMLVVEQHGASDICTEDSSGNEECVDASLASIDTGVFYALMLAIWF